MFVNGVQRGLLLPAFTLQVREVLRVVNSGSGL
jgi:hypothetical protein